MSRSRGSRAMGKRSSSRHTSHIIKGDTDGLLVVVVCRSETSRFSKTAASGPAVAAPAGHRRAGGFTITVSSGTSEVHSQVSTESLVISGGLLTIQAASTMIKLTINSRTQLNNPQRMSDLPAGQGARAMSRPKRKPQYVVEDGKPTAVILDIGQYEQMLERLEEVDDLATLQEMRKRPLKFRSLTAFLEEFDARV